MPVKILSLKMSLKAHIGFRRLAVVVFVFLNGILTASPFTYASTTAKDEPIAVDYTSQNQTTSDTEENNHFKNSEQRYEYQYTARKKTSTRFVNTARPYTTPIANYNSNLEHGFISSSFPALPGYYGLLFLYQLF